jgi:tetratricopeptide (TPR) repeat protein
MYHDRNYRDGEREFQIAIHLKPSLALAHQWYGNGLAGIGRFDEGIRELKRALLLDPISGPHELLGFALIWARRYDQAIEQAQKADDLNNGSGHEIRALAYEQMGNYEEAISQLRTWVDPLTPQQGKNPTPYVIADLAHVYAVSGRKSEARRLLAELTERSKSEFVPSWLFVIVNTGLGENDRAFEWLRKGLSEVPSNIDSLKVDPRMDPLRSDARYPEMLRRMGLPQ